MRQRVFVAMPFGKKNGPNGEIDFDAVYCDYLNPALEAAGFEVFRADEAQLSGNIHSAMFEELLLADLVVVDLSIPNPNVWYELGVRHALRARGVMHVRGTADALPFDVTGERILQYHLADDGRPDPEFLKDDSRSLAMFARNTMESWHGARHSPVYKLLPNLVEPDWRELRSDGINEARDRYRQWEQRLEVARLCKRVGDMLMLADEAPARMLQLEVRRTAGLALMRLGHYKLAEEQFTQALKPDPNDLLSRQQKAVALGRLGKTADARVLIDAILQHHTEDAETWGLKGRIAKEAWLGSWRAVSDVADAVRRATASKALLNEAANAYRSGFLRDPASYYAGINAVTLAALYRHVSGEDLWPRDTLNALSGGVAWAVECALHKNHADYWARASRGELQVAIGSIHEVESAFAAAVAVADNDWFALDSTRQQLEWLHQLGFRPQETASALGIVQRALDTLETPVKPKALLFSGHMVDSADRTIPRFPNDAEHITAAATAIASILDGIGVGDDDVAICSGAAGGDILFVEACLVRGARVLMYIPFDVPEFLDASVNFAGATWRRRFNSLREHARVELSCMPDRLGPDPAGANPFQRNNTWMLYSALACRARELHAILLWDGSEGDGPGGTADMYTAVQKHAGDVHHIDINSLW